MPFDPLTKKTDAIINQWPEDQGAKVFPVGMTQEASLEKIRSHRIQALEQVANIGNIAMSSGLGDYSEVLSANTALIHAKLETLDNKEERLKCFKNLFENQLLNWQRLHHSSLARGDEYDSLLEERARAKVYESRIQWLDEYASQSENPSIVQASIAPSQDTVKDFGNGVFPPRLLETFDVKLLRQSQIDALNSALATIRKLRESRNIPLSTLLQAEREWLDARLQSTHDVKERSGAIDEALKNAIAIWKGTQLLNKAGAKGGEIYNLYLSQAHVLYTKIRHGSENQTSRLQE